MGSVVVTWKGQCPRRDLQDELLSYLHFLAARSRARWSQPPSRRPAFVDVLTQHRAEGLPPLPDVRVFDEAWTGRLLIRSDVAQDHTALVAAAEAEGLVCEPEAARARYARLVVDRVWVRGLDFRLFDPRGLYPGEDRMSFAFLESTTAPFLNGRLVAVHDRSYCAASRIEAIRQADAYFECPYIHLRYYLEGWLDQLLGWIKFFFIPSLHYRAYEDLSGYAGVHDTLVELLSTYGVEQAKKRFFGALLDVFEEEADAWIGRMKTW
jgi:hypothetical protein